MYKRHVNITHFSSTVPPAVKGRLGIRTIYLEKARCLPALAWLVGSQRWAQRLCCSHQRRGTARHGTAQHGTKRHDTTAVSHAQSPHCAFNDNNKDVLFSSWSASGKLTYQQPTTPPPTTTPHHHPPPQTDQLQLNEDKTEVILFSAPSLSSCHEIVFSDKVRNLGFIPDSNLTMIMKQHLIKICQTAYYEVKCNSSIRRYLTEMQQNSW